MAAVTKKGNTHYVVYRMPKQEGEKTGKQIWEPFMEPEQANLRKAEIEAMFKAGRTPAHSRLTFEEFVNNKFIPVYGRKRWKNTTYDTNVGVIRSHLMPEFGGVLLRKITPYSVEKFLAHLADKKILSNAKYKTEDELRCISGQTANYIYVIFKTIMSKAAEWKEITETPVLCGPPCPDYQPKKRDFWTPSEVGIALCNMKHELLHLAVHLAFIATMREGEIAGLMLKNIDFDGCKILIDRQVQRVTKESLSTQSKKHVLHVLAGSEDSKSVLIAKQYSKNGESRDIYISPVLRDELLARKTHIEKCKEFYGDKFVDNGLVFCFDDGRPVEPKRITRWFSKWQNENDIALGLIRVVFHSLRHTSISHKLIMLNGNIKAVQKDSGHKTAAMILNVYSHIFEDQREELARKSYSNFYNLGQKQEVSSQHKENDNDDLVNILKNNPDMLVNALSAFVASNAQK